MISAPAAVVFSAGMSESDPPSRRSRGSAAGRQLGDPSYTKGELGDRLAQERSGQTLQPAPWSTRHPSVWLGVNSRRLDGGDHYFGAAVEAMRRIRCDHARHKGSQEARGRAAAGSGGRRGRTGWISGAPTAAGRSPSGRYIAGGAREDVPAGGHHCCPAAIPLLARSGRRPRNGGSPGPCRAYTPPTRVPRRFRIFFRPVVDSRRPAQVSERGVAWGTSHRTRPKPKSSWNRPWAGDRGSFDRLFGLHRAYLRQVVKRRLDPRVRGRVDPSDVLQETQLEALRRLPDYLDRRPMPFRLWLRKTAQERLLVAHRRHVGAARLRRRPRGAAARPVVAGPGPVVPGRRAHARPGIRPPRAGPPRPPGGGRTAGRRPRGPAHAGVRGALQPRGGRRPRHRPGHGQQAARPGPVAAAPAVGGRRPDGVAAMSASAASDPPSDELLGRIADEFLDRVARGEDPQVEEYVTRNPGLSRILREVLPALQVLRRSGSGRASVGPADEPDPGPTGRLGDFRHRPRGGPRRHGRRLRGRADLAGPAGGPEGAAVRRRRWTPGSCSASRTRRRRRPACTTRTSCRSTASAASGGVHFYAMQFIDGQTLADLDRRRCGGPAAEAAGGRRHRPALRAGSRPRPRTPDAGAAAARCPTERRGRRGRDFFRTAAAAGRPGGRGAGARPPAGHRPPRRQAGQPDAGRPRQAVGHRLRPGPVPEPDAGLTHDRRPGRHAALHEPGAGPGPAGGGRPPHRRLLAGRDPVRAADAASRPSRGRTGRSCCGRSPSRSRAGPARLEPGHPGGAGDDRPQGAGEEPGRPLRHGPGAGRRPAPVPGRPADPGPAADAAGSGRAKWARRHRPVVLVGGGGAPAGGPRVGRVRRTGRAGAGAETADVPGPGGDRPWPRPRPQTGRCWRPSGYFQDSPWPGGPGRPDTCARPRRSSSACARPPAAWEWHYLKRWVRRPNPRSARQPRVRGGR